MDMNLSRLGKIEKDKEAWGAAVHGVANSRTEQQPQPIPSPMCFFYGHIGLSVKAFCH